MDDRGTESTADGAGTPLWLRALGIALLIAVVLIVVVMLAGSGGHAPRPH